ncbi:MAG TPA: hypothetical protein VIT19_10595 [Pyrinomonadaceae bacterium]
MSIGVSVRSDYFAPLSAQEIRLGRLTQAVGLGYFIARRKRF